MSDRYDLLNSVTATLSRRSFLAWMIATVTIARGMHIGLLQPVQREALDDALLLALAGAVLPSELGANGVRKAAFELQAWVLGYRPNVERNHAYGSARLSNTGPDPSPRWSQQLRAFDAAARVAHGRGFPSLTIAERRALVASQLNADRATAIPGDVASASHVTLALLASFYSSPDATDLCYEARIQKGTCRPLATSSQRPLPLAGRGLR